MTEDQNYKDIINNLIAHKGSISEQREIAKKLRDEDLSKIAPYSQHAKEELEERRYKKLLFWAIVCSILTLIVMLIMLFK